ncbi:MAG: hypothetical protein D6732_19610 [Methanobacteriota archaeon]|nr:MAG: hypothetical protein D6732_19610 [Euryarchaeota archaeon]
MIVKKRLPVAGHASHYRKTLTISPSVIRVGLIGILSPFHINFLGQIYVGEIFFLAYLLYIWISKRKIFLPHFTRLFLLFATGWMLNQMVTDLLRGTPANDFLRGWASILFLIVDVLGLFYLIRQQLRLWIAFAWGYALGGLVVPLVQPEFFYAGNSWKFGYADPVILIMLLWIADRLNGKSRLSNWWPVILMLIAMGTYSFWQDSRRWGGLLWLTATMVIWKLIAKARRRRAHIRWATVVTFVVAAGLILQGFVYAANRGWFGEDVKQRTEMHSAQNFGTLGVLLGGRSQIFVSIQAIANAPLIGHGSWAKDIQYRYLLYDVQDSLGITNSNLENFITSKNEIPAHSHILRAWVWAGILGGIFWIVILWFCIKFLLANLEGRLTNFSPFWIYWGLYSVWDILFTPFGGDLRLIWAMRLTSLAGFGAHMVTNVLHQKRSRA